MVDPNPNPGDDIEAVFKLDESKRLRYLEDLIQTRKSDLDYFKQVYAHATFWLNTTPIVEFPRSDSCSFFYLLGLSLGKLIHKPDPVILARGGVQLMEEIEFHFSTHLLHLLTSTQKTNVLYPTTSALDCLPLNEPFKPTIYKFYHDGQPVYQVLLIPPTVGIEMDYARVVYSVCEMLRHFYTKLYDVSLVQNPHVFQTMLQFDKKIQARVIQVFTKELTSLAQAQVSSEIRSLSLNP